MHVPVKPEPGGTTDALVYVVTGKMLLEELVGQERFFDADALKTTIGTLEQRKTALMA